ncbi:pyridoxal phosphate-dependent aminotransferase [Actinophytocola sp.]|uniref:pyridoxal phosphate-dependent aminotransferase n=1 Tax=Actinophytocola sp. TaxID=1872138 RepID=UPI002ED80E56
MAVSATLAAHQVVEERRRAGLPVLPMSFGQAGVPVHPLLAEALAAAAGRTAYGPVAGDPALREAAAGYWTRRGLPTDPEQVLCGPGSKALLYASLLAVDGDVLLPRPSWVSYAQQVALLGRSPVLLPTRPGEGGVVDPDTVRPGARAMVLTLPDNPTGRLATPATVRAVCAAAREHDLVMISDEIYRDLVYADEFVSPAELAPERTIVTTGLSKSLALGGWRIGVARFPAGPLLDTALSVASELWSCPAVPVQAAAALAFSEPPALRSYVDSARRLYEKVNIEVANRFAAAGADVATPQAAFYSYPDLAPHRALLADRHDVHTGAGLAELLLSRHGVAVLPGVEFGEPASSLRVRVATGQLTGETDAQRREALAAADPLALPWLAAALDQLTNALTTVLR